MSIEDVFKIEKEILNKFKDNDDIKVFTDYDIDNCELQILVEKDGYSSRIYYDINEILNSDLNFEEVTKIITNRIYEIQLVINEEKGEEYEVEQ